MRCPKCGYISFDSQQSCGKCGRDLSEIATLLEGTVSRDSPPEFLAAALAPVPPEDQEGSESSDPEIVETFGPRPEPGEEQLGPAPEPADETHNLAPDTEADELDLQAENLEPESAAVLPVEPTPPGDTPGEITASAREAGATKEAAEDLPTVESIEPAIPVVHEIELDEAAGSDATNQFDDLGEAAADDLLDLTGEQPPEKREQPTSATDEEDLSESSSDLGDLLDLVGGDQPEAPPPPEMESGVEDISDLLSDSDREAAADELILEIADDDTPLGAATTRESTPDIPDLGLSLESEEDIEK